MTARLDKRQQKERKELFGSIREGFRPIKPYLWEMNGSQLLEIPVTTMPLFRVPIHLSYLLYLLRFSRLLARSYLRFAVGLCRLTGVGPSVLLHPLDFLGSEDNVDLDFFPAMDLAAPRKIELISEVLETMAKHYTISTMTAHADELTGKDVEGKRLRRVRIGGH